MTKPKPQLVLDLNSFGSTESDLRFSVSSQESSHHGISASEIESPSCMSNKDGAKARAQQGGIRKQKCEVGALSNARGALEHNRARRTICSR